MIEPAALATWQLIRDSLVQAQPVMLLYVLDSWGSSPGRQGFRMAVTATGAMAGSIGGGIMEHKFVELAKEKLLDNSFTSLARKQYHDKRAVKDQSGMICSGHQTIWLYRVQAADLPAINQLIACLQQRRQGLLTLSPAGIVCSNSLPTFPEAQLSWESELAWQYQEPIGYPNRLYIVGGGHCALALSQLMGQMDFYISLFDDRPNLLTLQQNDAAHQKTLVNSYADLAAFIPQSNTHYVVIMTFGYRTDDQAIRALINHDVGYIGVLGSQTKINTLFSAYRAEGIPEARLSRFHAPIGLPIFSQTPLEIAVSIAAEIIRQKNKPQE